MPVEYMLIKIASGWIRALFSGRRNGSETVPVRGRMMQGTACRYESLKRNPPYGGKRIYSLSFFFALYANIPMRNTAMAAKRGMK